MTKWNDSSLDRVDSNDESFLNTRDLLPPEEQPCVEETDVAMETPSQLGDLWREYHSLVKAIRQQRDPALELRLTVVMYDLGLYRPSPP